MSRQPMNRRYLLGLLAAVTTAPLLPKTPPRPPRSTLTLVEDPLSDIPRAVLWYDPSSPIELTPFPWKQMHVEIKPRNR